MIRKELSPDWFRRVSLGGECLHRCQNDVKLSRDWCRGGLRKPSEQNEPSSCIPIFLI